MSEHAPSTAEILAAFEPFADPAADGGGCLWALTGTGWHRIAQYRAGDDRAELLHAVRLYIHATRRLPCDSDGAPLYGLRLLACHTGDHLDPSRRVIEAATPGGATYLLTRHGDAPATVTGPVSAGQASPVPGALAMLAEAWAATPPQARRDHSSVCEERAAFELILTRAADVLPDRMPDDARVRCTATALQWCAADIADQVYRDRHARTDERIAECARQVSGRLSVAVEDGDIDLDAAQHIITDLQLPPLNVDFTVRLLVPITVEVHGNCPEAAEDCARDRIDILLDGHDDAYLDREAVTAQHINGPHRRTDRATTTQRCLLHPADHARPGTEWSP